MAPVVHQLIEHKGEGANGAAPYRLTSRCGHTEQRRGLSEAFPESFTGWASRVTCDACLKRDVALAS